MPQGDRIEVGQLLSSDTSLFDKYIKKIDAIEKTYIGFIDAVEQRGAKLEQVNNKLIQNITKLEGDLKAVNITIQSQQEESMKLVEIINKEAEEFEKLSKLQKENADITDKLTKEKDELTAAAEELYKIQQQNVKLQDKLNGLDTESAKKQAQIKLAIQERNKELKEQAKEAAGLITEYDKESKRLETLRKAYKGVAAEYGVNSKEAKKLVKEVEELDDKLKEIDASAGQQQRNVGGYADALREVGGSSGVAVDGIQSLNVTFKALLANPVVLVIAAIVAGLVGLFNMFKKTAFGGELLAKSGAFVDGVFSSLVGLTDKLRIGLQSVFEDPLGALEDLGDAILTNVVNRFQAIPKLLQLAGKAFSQLTKGDLAGLKETALEAGQAFIQLQTGLDENQQKSFAGVTKEVLDNAKAFEELEAARRRVRKENRQLEISAEKLLTQEGKLNSIRDDATKSFAVREAASELARQKLEQRTQAELKLAKNNLDLLNAEVKLRKSNGEAIEDLLDEQLEAYKAFIGAEREYTLAVRENEKERDQLKQDRLEKDLDILIDGFDNQKTINERIIADDRKVIEERRKLFEQTQKLSDDTFAKQIETIQQFTGQAIDANDLLATSDAVVLNEKIRQLGLSEIIEGRLLEVIRERRIVAQDLADIERDLTQAEFERQQRLREVSQFELDRYAARKSLEAEFARFSFTSINERVQADINAERFRTETLLQDETLLAEERRRIRQELEDKITEIQRQGTEDRAALIQQEAEKFIEFALQIGNLFGALSARRTQDENIRIEALEEQKQRELDLAGGNAVQKEAIEKKFDAEKEKIERKQAQRARRLAIFEKAIAITESVSQTALAVVKALANPPGPPFSIPQAIAAGAFGGFRTATIAAQPIPAFFKGTSHSPFGKAIVGEIGPELIIKPSNGVEIANKPQLIDLPGGSKVLNHVTTKNILNRVKENSIIDDIVLNNNKQKINFSKNDSIKVLEIISKNNNKVVSGLREAIKELPEIHQFHFGRFGLQRDRRRGNTLDIDIKKENDW